jgi:hypothetical protein
MAAVQEITELRLAAERSALEEGPGRYCVHGHQNTLPDVARHVIDTHL